ncbi:MAG: AraC family transcriptional regulator [Tannerella sp.]|nr:AraC family transcriptional regulator [Tannerella sp.]
MNFYENNEMEIDRPNVEDPEALRREVILEYFELLGQTGGYLRGIEHLPGIAETGFVAICIKGECVLMLDHTVYNFKAGRICVGFAAAEVRTLWKSSDFECMALAADLEFLRHINDPSVSDLFTAIRNNPCMSLSDEEMIALPACFKYIRSVYKRKEQAYHMEITKRLLLVLCYEVAAVYQRNQPAKKPVDMDKDTIFRDFVHLLSSKYQEERRVAYYAKELHVTPGYLTGAVKDASDKTAAEWIDDIVLRNIKILLTTTTLTIQQISERLNFPNPSFFTKYFRRSTGKTPKAFRNAGRNASPSR